MLYPSSFPPNAGGARSFWVFSSMIQRWTWRKDRPTFDASWCKLTQTFNFSDASWRKMTEECMGNERVCMAHKRWYRFLVRLHRRNERFDDWSNLVYNKNSYVHSVHRQTERKQVFVAWQNKQVYVINKHDDASYNCWSKTNKCLSCRKKRMKTEQHLLPPRHESLQMAFESDTAPDDRCWQQSVCYRH